MSDIMKNFIKTIVFLIIFSILFHFTTKILVFKDEEFGSDITSFYNEKKNSLDIIFFGSSHGYCTYSPDIINEEMGYNSYILGTPLQPSYITYYLMVESLKYQKPKYWVLEIKSFAILDDYAKESTNRSAIDKMRFSANKIEAINASIENKSDRFSYYFNIIKYHSRYNEITKKEIADAMLNRGLKNKGFTALKPDNNVLIENGDKANTKETHDLTIKNQKYLNKIINLAKDNNIQLIFVKSPNTLRNDDQLYYNKVFEIAKENNIAYIDYNKLFDELELTYGDFYDSGHVAESGAIKVTKHFIKDLQKIEEN